MTSKPVPYYLKEIVLPYALVQKSETRLRRRRLSLPVAYLLNNGIVTYSH